MAQTSPLTDDGTEFAALDWDGKFEFAQYIVNTPADDRSEIPGEQALAALEWASKQKF